MRTFHALTAMASVAGVLVLGTAADAQPDPREGAGRTMPVAGTAASTPVFIAGCYHGRRPHNIELSGDAGNIVTGLRWSRWTATRATGKGTSDIQGCVPNCASGTQTPVKTWITLRDPKHGYFTKLIERRDGHTETFTYTPHHLPDNWPGHAS